MASSNQHALQLEQHLDWRLNLIDNGDEVYGVALGWSPYPRTCRFVQTVRLPGFARSTPATITTAVLSYHPCMSKTSWIAATPRLPSMNQRWDFFRHQRDA